MAVGGLYAGGAFTRGEVYDLPVAEVRSRLVTLSVPTQIRASAGGSDRASVAIDVEPESISWKVANGRGEAARFTANYRAEGPSRTRVTLDYSSGRSGYTYVDRLMSTSFMRSFAEAVFAEQVDARLDGRAVDESQALQEFARGAATHPEQVRELGEVTRSMFNDVSEQIHEQAYSGDVRQSSPRETMNAATKPSLVLPKEE
jgi:hypothetical protein